MRVRLASSEGLRHGKSHGTAKLRIVRDTESAPEHEANSTSRIEILREQYINGTLHVDELELARRLVFLILSHQEYPPIYSTRSW